MAFLQISTRFVNSQCLLEASLASFCDVVKSLSLLASIMLLNEANVASTLARLRIPAPYSLYTKYYYL